MNRKQQKWVAVLVTVAFVWLLQVSAMPVAAAGASERIGSTFNDQGPRFIEQEGDSGTKAKGKSILPLVLIGVGVAAVAAVLFLVVLKTKYDPRGTWSMKWRNDPGKAWASGDVLIMSGERTSGTTNYQGTPGTYALDGKKLTLIWTYAGSNTVTTTCEFQTEDFITGTFKSSLYADIDGQMELSRQGTTASAETNTAKKRIGE